MNEELRLGMVGVVGQAETNESGCREARVPRPEPTLSADFRPVEINKVVNGYVVKVGCKLVVFECKEKMLAEIGRYFDNPMQVEKEYLNKK